MINFSGSMTALVTPFKDGKVDEASLRGLVKRQIDGGTSAVVPVGTTGESPTLNTAEAEQVIRIVIEEAKGKLAVIAGTGSYDTRASVERSQWAKKAGADAVLAVCPYYNKPSQQGVYLHYKAIAEGGGLPVVVYTIPGRSVINITPDTIAKLAQVPGIGAVKEASGSLSQMAEIIAACGDKLPLLSGDDGLTLPVLALGGKGVISVASNIIPRAMADLVAAGLKGDFAAARAIHYKHLELFKALFLETNPIGIKHAVAKLGWCGPEIRLPLTPMEASNAAKLEAALGALGLKA
jgi:4-hydroxy-tetrahydrodipicolinate synthase